MLIIVVVVLDLVKHNLLMLFLGLCFMIYLWYIFRPLFALYYQGVILLDIMKGSCLIWREPKHEHGDVFTSERTTIFRQDIQNGLLY